LNWDLPIIKEKEFDEKMQVMKDMQKIMIANKMKLANIEYFIFIA
jgi:hypothetical protein